ncbi:arginine--tRNA ligase [Leptospira sp. 96542]|nr:arginine--tRNA ligase [Leptospira sp. 96542]
MKQKELLKQIVLTELTQAIGSFLNKDQNHINLTDLKIRIEYSRDEKFGDYSTPFALENKNSFNKNPKEIAESILPYLEGKPIFSSVSFSPPGFINFRISLDFLLKYITNSFFPNLVYANIDDPKKIILEFVSANPTGPMNIVSARSAALGDALTNLQQTLGNAVEREFYVNDYGNQVYLLGVAVFLRIKELLGETLLFQEEEDGRSINELIETNVLPKESYRGEYIKNIAKEFIGLESNKLKIEDWMKNKDWDGACDFLSRFSVEYNLSRQKEDLNLFGVNFNRFFSERSLHESGDVENISNLLKPEDIKLIENKLHFLSTNYGDDKDRVIKREDGRPTYLMADIAYHINKFNRGFDTVIDIWGPDHYGYIARLKGAMLSFGKREEDFKVIIAQQVNLIENKEKVKMSKRLGIFQTMRDLMSYLGKNAKDVGRYFFLMRSSDAPLDFDLDLAKDESDKNPVFYLQYAHARICSIYRELDEDLSQTDWDTKIGLEFLKDEERSRLLFWVSRFQEEVFDAATSFEPHRLTNYLQSLSKSFTRFYSHKNNRIKEKVGLEKDTLLYLILVTKIALANGLSLLGISSPERMSKEES